MKRLTTRGIRTAEAIRDREPFKTSGSLEAGDLAYYDTGRLDQHEVDAYWRDRNTMDYIVYSYATPIAWHSTENGWHVVTQKFSSTTSKHQSNLYMIDRNPVLPDARLVPDVNGNPAIFD